MAWVPQGLQKKLDLTQKWYCAQRLSDDVTFIYNVNIHILYTWYGLEVTENRAARTFEIWINNHSDNWWRSLLLEKYI
jgi:hypothetical protein